MPSPNSQDVDNGQDAHVQEEQGAAVPGSDVEQDETMEDDAANGNDESAGNNRAVVDREEATATDVLADVSGLEGVKRLLGKDKTFEEYITVAGYVYEEKVTGKCAVMAVDVV